MPFELKIPTTFCPGAFKRAVKEALDEYIGYSRWYGLFQPSKNRPVIELINDFSRVFYAWDSRIIERLEAIDAMQQSRLADRVREQLFSYIEQHILQSSPTFFRDYNNETYKLAVLLFSLEHQQIMYLLHQNFAEEKPLIYFLLKYKPEFMLTFMKQLSVSQIQILFNIPADLMKSIIADESNLYFATRNKMGVYATQMIQAVIRYNPSVLGHAHEITEYNLLIQIALERSQSFKEIYESLNPEEQHTALSITNTDRFSLLSAAITSKNKQLAFYVYDQYKRVLGDGFIKTMILNTDKHNLVESAIKHQPEILILLLTQLDSRETTHLFTQARYQGDHYLMKASESLHSSLPVLLFQLNTTPEQQLEALAFTRARGEHALLNAALFYHKYISTSYQACFTELFDSILKLMVQVLPKEEQARYLAHPDTNGTSVLSCLLSLAVKEHQQISCNLFARVEAIISSFSDEDQTALWEPLVKKFGSFVVGQQFTSVFGYTPPSFQNAPVETMPISTMPTRNTHRFYQPESTDTSASTQPEPSASVMKWTHSPQSAS